MCILFITFQADTVSLMNTVKVSFYFTPLSLVQFLYWKFITLSPKNTNSSSCVTFEPNGYSGGWFFRKLSFWFYIVYNSLKIHILRNELWWEILLRISKATDHWLFEVSSNFIIYNSARECICYFYCLKMYIIISRISLM